MSRFLVVPTVALVVALSAGQALRAQEAGSVDVTGRSQLKIETALEGETEIDFFDTALSDVADWLRQTHNIPVVLDTRPLQDVGIAVDTPITFSIEGVTLATALDLVLRPLDLRWTVYQGVLLITTPEEEENQLITKVYPVDDLLPDDAMQPAVPYTGGVHGMGGGFGGGAGPGGGGFFSVPGSEPSDAAPADQADQPGEGTPSEMPAGGIDVGAGGMPLCGTGLGAFAAYGSADLLIDAITTTIAPESWEEVGGSASIGPLKTPKGIVLVISQTYRNHKKVAKLLADLRAVNQSHGAP